MIRQGLKSLIHFLSTSKLDAPLDQMIIKHPLVKLMEKVRGKTLKNICVWKILPEWFLHHPQAESAEVR